MKIKHIKSGLSVFAFAYAAHFTVGCSCLNGNLNMYNQKSEKITDIGSQKNQTNNASKKLIFFDFDYFFPGESLRLNLDDKYSYFEYDSEGPHILGPCIIKEGDILSFEDSIYKDASINPNYNEELVKDTTRSLLKGKSDPEKYRKLIVDPLEVGHKVVISAYTCHPHVVTETLKYIGLKEHQIKDILILFSAKNKSTKIHYTSSYSRRFKEGLSAAKKLTGIENMANIDYYIDRNKMR